MQCNALVIAKSNFLLCLAFKLAQPFQREKATICSVFQMFFIDHNAKATSFIDPRLPNELPLLQNEAGAMATPMTPRLLEPINDQHATLLPPPLPRHHGASLTPPPSARLPSPAPPNRLAPPTEPVNRRRSRSVGDEELNSCLTAQRSSSRNHLLPLSPMATPTIEATPPPMGYNDKVVAFLRQPNIMAILKEKSSMNQRGIKDKIMAIRQEGTTALNRLSHDVELTMMLR